jgi:hypothetical protein
VVVVLFVVTATQRHGQANDQHQYKHNRTGFAHAADVHLEFRLRVLETAHEVWWRAEAGIRGRRGVVGYHQLPVHLVPLAGGTASSVIVGVHHQLSVHLVPLASGGSCSSQRGLPRQSVRDDEQPVADLLAGLSVSLKSTSAHGSTSRTTSPCVNRRAGIRSGGQHIS